VALQCSSHERDPARLVTLCLEAKRHRSEVYAVDRTTGKTLKVLTMTVRPFHALSLCFIMRRSVHSRMINASIWEEHSIRIGQ
jgi:hypothetical protein